MAKLLERLSQRQQTGAIHYNIPKPSTPILLSSHSSVDLHHATHSAPFQGGDHVARTHDSFRPSCFLCLSKAKIPQRRQRFHREIWRDWVHRRAVRRSNEWEQRDDVLQGTGSILFPSRQFWLHPQSLRRLTWNAAIQFLIPSGVFLVSCAPRAEYIAAILNKTLIRSN